MKKKVAFISGITGMVGSHLADYLLKHTDWDIVGMLRWRSALDNIAHFVDKINKNDRISLVYASLTDSIAINEVIKKTIPDYVFHLAAQSFPKTSFASPLETLDVNIQGTVRMLNAIREYCPEAWVHVCSSSEVFGKVKKDQLPINEECTFHPASPYAISKVGTDLIGRFYAEAYNLNIITTRMFTHTGPRRGDVFAESTFCKQIAMIEESLTEPVISVGNLKSLRTIADVRDAVRAYYMLLTINPIRGEYYNIGSNYSCTIEEMLNFLLSLSSVGKKIQIKVDPNRMRLIDADLQIPDTKKFSTHTGWKTEISFEKTMKDLLNHWRFKIKQRGRTGFLLR
tara:strand:+ start:41 stop:1063 length:1023 start_codon:yes stop_codon:yes gene_type:complete